MDENDNRLFLISKILLPLLAGISITLLVEVLADDLLFYRPEGAPIGWALLWGITTPLSIAMGIGALTFKSWRNVPFAKRWMVGLGYLVLGFFNAVDIYLLVDETFLRSHQIFWGLFVYAGLLVGGFFYLAYRVNKKEEIFP